MALAGNGLDLGAVQYMINHIFLPPELPSSNDFNVSYESALIDTTIAALWKFRGHQPDGQSLTIDSIIGLMNNMKNVHTSGSINEDRLGTALKVLSERGGTLPLHVRAQNAGLILSRIDNSIRVEAFELSPLNEAVITTKGRLRRSFPGAALDLKQEIFEQPTFRATIANTLATMSHEEAPGTQPQVRKARQNHDEERDTTHPKMITELFLAFLGPLAKPMDVPSLIKNTRDEVLYHNAFKPWRRSSMWLLIRVAIQREMARLASDMPENFYKTFMVFLMSHVLELSHGYHFSCDLIFAMNAKLVRRLLKFNSSFDTPGLEVVRRIVQDTYKLLQSTWSTIMKQAEPPCELSRLASLSFGSDTSISLPVLNQYLSLMDERKATSTSVAVQSQSSLNKYPADDLPTIAAFACSDLVLHNLKALETWIEDNLSTWLNCHKGDPSTCGRLAVLFRGYYATAHKLYTGNPEATSIMLLTSLEIWIACDESATHICELLKEYGPGIPRELLTNLALPFRSQMQRLLRAEDYLIRRSRANVPAPHIFRDFGSQSSFAVRYFEQSAEHKQLLRKIETQATETRQRKCEELRKKKARYNSLIKSHDSVECEYQEVITDIYNDFREERHVPSCKKCHYKSEAGKISIEIHEWPLPSTSLKTKATVFELRVPPWFGHWRDTTMFFIIEILKVEYVLPQRPRTSYPLQRRECGLSSFFSQFNRAQRIGLLSQNKPHYGTHRRDKTINKVTEMEVCLGNGLNYEYHDSSVGCFVGEFRTTDQIPKLCTFTLPTKCSSVQQFLCRPSSTPHGPPPNAIIATQSDCPDGMTIDEYRALSAIPLGCRIQWQNILLQLVMPTVDLKKIETSLVVLQTIYQAGPRGDDNVLRDGHAILGSRTFANTLLTSLEQALQRIKENWESSQVLGTLVTLATRVLSLTDSEEIREKSLAYLNVVRGIAFKWVDYLKGKVRKSTDGHQRTEFHSKAVEFALICADSFYLEGTHLDDTLSTGTDASIFLQCSIIIQEESNLISSSSNPMISRLYWRWKGLSYRSYRILRGNIDQGKSGSVDDAVQKSWTAYQGGQDWQIMSQDVDHWLVSRTAIGGGGGSLSIHFNLLTGELLVNGLPLARLPSQYEGHPMYRTLFGEACLEVMPTTVQGMQFSGKKDFSGYSLHFNIESILDESGRSVGLDFLVQAIKDERKYQLIPSRLIRGELPSAFVDDFVHWYNMNDDCVEFRSAEDPWIESSENWRLVRSSTGSPWRLMKHEASLVGVKSETAKLLSTIFSPLEDQFRIHNIFHHSSSSLDIELPRLQLSFHLKSHSPSIESRQFRGMKIDPDQSLGTLVGLLNKLVLKYEKGDNRLVIIPEGEVTYERVAGHVRVSVQKDSAAKAHAYHVDSHIGRLVDNGSLRSKLFLCYLHGVTAFCLVDPLTKKTGTEQAISILNSAAVRSFVRLTQEDVEILSKIARLTPGRKYYPENERVMQTVTWSKLGFMAQHGRFYTSVNSILDQADTYDVFNPEASVERLRPDHVQVHLLERDFIRSSTLRVSGFGAEDHSVNYDIVYSSRDRNQNSSQGFQAFIMSSTICHERKLLHYHVHGDLTSLLWAAFSKINDVHGPGLEPPLCDMRYSAKQLLEPAKIVSKYWSSLHETFSRSNPRFDKFGLMIWLSTLAFAKDSDMQILQSLAFLFSAPDAIPMSAPFVKIFQLGKGSKINSPDLRNAFRPAALTPFHQCAEANLPKYTWENARALKKRRQSTFKNNQDRALNKFLKELEAQWPYEVPVIPSCYSFDTPCPYIDMDKALLIAKPKFKIWFDNHQYAKYLKRIADALNEQQISPVQSLVYPVSSRAINGQRGQGCGFVNIEDIFACSTPSVLVPENRILDGLISSDLSAEKPIFRLAALLQNAESQTHSSYEENYIKDLRGSLTSLQSRSSQSGLQLTGDAIKEALIVNLNRCQKHVYQVYEAIVSALGLPNGSKASEIAVGVKQSPRVSPIFLLQQLSRTRWQKISNDWKISIVQYGHALTDLHRAQRLLSLASNHADLIRELQNSGHKNWNSLDYPESLLLEVESGIMIREVQEEIAHHMRNPQPGANTVMQLNMGEGKSSVIVPIVAAALADGARLVRVIVAKPQSKEMFQMLVSKLGGLLDRRVYHMPFSRSIKLEQAEAISIGNIYQECMAQGGILLVQPEHILSFKLMCLECFITNRENVGESLLRTQEFFDTSSRDIVDESDENFSVKFELIYTMGMQRPIDSSPDRWVCIQHVLDLVKAFAPNTRKLFPDSISVHERQPGSFPRTRILRSDAELQLFSLVAKHICETGMNGFPIARQPEPVRGAVYIYLTESTLTSDEISKVEDRGPGGFWSDSTRNTLLLLRGLLAGGVLAFAFGQKRWRVNYGLDVLRKPPTRLAVPYRAKDNPTARSEFSHPDVVIVLTSLTYYYGGLRDEDMFLAFHHLAKSDQADIEYQAWVRDAPDLPLAFHHLLGINLKDKLQCIEEVFPPLRYAKGVIDYFLAHIVFPKEMKEFPDKLSASGWDIGQIKVHPTTGFSGTNDSRKLLPLSVGHLDLPEQEHTNALVLEYLLGPENSVSLIHPRQDASSSDAQALLVMVTAMQPDVQVILDVGAQILELSNLEVAKEWLRMVPGHGIQAVVFFNDNDELCVIDRRDNIEALQTSSFAAQLDVCLVYLDDSHTRGTDLKLPTSYRAAVTLGPNLTKDRLVQACMRMRKLGKGQSVVFCVPEEIKTKILTRTSKSNGTDIDVSDVLSWAISETFADTRRSMPLWAVQGQRFEQQNAIWAEARVNNGMLMSKTLADKFLEDESQSLNDRYRPRPSSDVTSIVKASNNRNLNLIVERCKELDNLQFDSATLREEQERELSPEIEQERQVQKPASAQPAPHSLHPDLVKFVSAGNLIPGSKAFMPAFQAMRTTSAAAYLNVSQFPQDLLVTADFANTIQVPNTISYVSDCYQRPVQWILTSTGAFNSKSVKYMLIISPFEAQRIMPDVSASKTTTLHLYAPRPTLGFRALDTLDLFTVPSRPDLILPRNLVVLLNLFAGQLYLDSFKEYIEVCELLGLAWDKSEEGCGVAADGFILQNGNVKSSFQSSPTRFLKVLMTKVRRNCESIEKTHMGKILDGRLLTRADFEELEDGDNGSVPAI
ncbi:hypothetical protein BDZ45DRAFT_140606 [Acephala macrosclerotiorum]|nr:hypothetical protein BDZ45DRAFT_140606 [Acephala macrosclerotiorum]